jgi:GNAT superfamily N-acetyltransferase
MTVRIRPLEAADHDRWLELWNGYLEFYKEELPQDITKLTWRRILSSGSDPSGIFGIAAIGEDGEIIGIAHYIYHRSTWARGWYCYLEDLFVDPRARGRGAGRALIGAVKHAAREHGCSRMYLATQEFNATARALYDTVLTLSPFVQYRVNLD